MKNITIHDGLAGETVFNIFKSKWNVIWVATSNGLSSYDGFYIRAIRVDERNSKIAIKDIAQGSDGYIWAATAEGLYVVDGTNTKLKRVLPDIKGNLTCMKIDGDRLFCGSEDGLYVASASRKEKEVRRVWLSKNHVAGNNMVNDMVVEGNSLYVLTNYELYRYDIPTGRVKSYNLRSRLNTNYPLRKLVKTGNRIIIGTFNNGLFVYDIKGNTLEPYVDVHCRIITCLSTHKDKLYVGTDGSGLHIISLKENRILETYSTDENSRFRLKDNTVYAYYHDPTGVDFFGYYRQGLHHNYFSRKLFHAYNIPGLFDSRGKNIRSICIDGDVKVLGGRGGLWYVDETRRITKFFYPEELGGSIVTNVVKYAGQYYCCTFNGGVMRIDPQTLTTSRFGKDEALRISSFGCLKVSPDNELWMSGTAGIYIYNAFTGEMKHFDFRNSQLPQAYCNNLLFDSQDRCWISTSKGICLYDPVSNTIHSKGFPKDFPEGFFHFSTEMSGAIAKGDNLLFWSTDGLLRTNEEMTDYETLATNTPAVKQKISQLIYDKRHKNYWISTEAGMFRYNSDLKSFRKFADEAGLMSSSFSNNAISIVGQKTLWTGTMDGLYYCDLDEAAKFSIGNTAIVLNNMTFDGEAATDETVAVMLRKNEVTLTYHWGSQNFSFIPVLMNYCKQSQLYFEYRVNKESEWKHINGEGTITLDGLPLGHNVMEIRIAGNEYATVFDINVVPSGWFVFEIISIFVFCGVLALLYRLHIAEKKRKEEIKRVQLELEMTKRKYSRVNSDDSDMQRLMQRLENYMRTDKPFLNNELKLSDMASHLEVSTVKLSQLFSMYVKKNYYDYVNQWRLEEFKSLVNNNNYANYTLLALAEECGFKRSSFFSTFKKVEGVTPTEYVKQHKNPQPRGGSMP